MGRPVGAVVQGPLQPLDGSRLHGVAQQRHQVAGQATATLRPHGVPLVGHGTGTWTHVTGMSNISNSNGKWVGVGVRARACACACVCVCVCLL